MVFIHVFVHDTENHNYIEILTLLLHYKEDRLILLYRLVLSWRGREGCLFPIGNFVRDTEFSGDANHDFRSKDLIIVGFITHYFIRFITENPIANT